MRDGETPDAYGLGIDKPGELYAGSLPTGTARNHSVHADPSNNHTPHSITIANLDWYYIHNRLWGVGDASNRADDVYYFAPGYDTDLYTSGYGKIVCDDDSGNVIGLIPFANRLLAYKSGSAYVLHEANQWGGSFLRGRVFEGFGAAGTNDITEAHGIVYANNANGVFAFDGQAIKELTYSIRNDLGNFTGADLDGTNSSGFEYTKNRLVADDGTKQYVVDLDTGGLYDYTTSGFRWTSRTIESSSDVALWISRIAFLIRQADTKRKTVRFQIKKDDGTWAPVQVETIKSEDFEHQRYECQLDWTRQQQKWAMRITYLPSNLYIQEVHVQLDQGTVLENEEETRRR